MKPRPLAPAESFSAEDALIAADSVREQLQIDDGSIAAAIVLGSGLGGLARRIADAQSVPFSRIPGFPVATVQGHAGVLMHGTLGGRKVLLLAGRFHLYEGHPSALAGFPVRVMHALGARTLVVSNAAGGVRRTFTPGDLMIIADHLNLMGTDPLLGHVHPAERRQSDMSAPYDRDLRERLRETARLTGVPVCEGVYAALPGPAYETRAEVRMLERLGADAVGMSTVPEVLVARSLGMRVAGISCITNLACGLSPHALSHEEVLETTTRVAARFEQLIETFVQQHLGDQASAQ
jgi:purine-nucleoside phosphorylase